MNKLTEHLKEQKESYLQHMRGAWKIIWVLKTIELKCLIHSIFPFLYTTAVSEKLESLRKMCERKKK